MVKVDDLALVSVDDHLIEPPERWYSCDSFAHVPRDRARRAVAAGAS